MDLVVLYGPPATGKLTVARKLSEITGYQIFDNHSSLDQVSKEFPDLIFGSGEFSKKVVEIRIQKIEEAAMNGISMIFTSIWRNANYESAQNLVEIVEKHGGKVHFAYLTASREELLRRVEGESRRPFGKIVDREQLAAYLDAHGVPIRAPIPNSFSIDNTNIGPREAAQAIVEHFGLKTLSKSRD